MPDTFPVNNGSLGTRNSSNSINTIPNNQVSEPSGIIDVTGREVPFTIDTFLQSLPGSLSTILSSLANNLFQQLPQFAQDLISSTALSGVLSGAISNFSTAISESIGRFAGALQDAASSLLNDIGETISEIPGIGPVLQDFIRVTRNFSNNLSQAYNSLPQSTQEFIQSATLQIGAGIVDGNRNLQNFSSLFTETQTEEIRRNINFTANPASDMQQISTQARNLDQIIFEVTGNDIFANLSSRAQESATQITRLLQSSDNGFVFRNVIPRADLENVQFVVNGQIIDQQQINLDNQLREAADTYINRG